MINDHLSRSDTVNILFQADESEIMLAVDNGNVEVYDRHSLELKTALVGQVRTDDIITLLTSIRTWKRVENVLTTHGN